MNNYFSQIPNEYMFKKAKTKLTETENAILTIIEQKTFGYQKEYSIISTSFFEKTTKRTQRAILKALKNLKNRKIIIHFGYEKKQNVWGINMNYSEWETRMETDEPNEPNGEQLQTEREQIRTKIKSWKNPQKKEKTIGYISGNYDFEELERIVRSN